MLLLLRCAAAEISDSVDYEKSQSNNYGRCSTQRISEVAVDCKESQALEPSRDAEAPHLTAQGSVSDRSGLCQTTTSV